MNTMELQLQANWLEDKHFCFMLLLLLTDYLYYFAVFVDLVLLAINIIIFIIIAKSYWRKLCKKLLIFIAK